MRCVIAVIGFSGGHYCSSAGEHKPRQKRTSHSSIRLFKSSLPNLLFQRTQLFSSGPLSSSPPLSQYLGHHHHQHHHHSTRCACSRSGPPRSTSHLFATCKSYARPLPSRLPRTITCENMLRIIAQNFPAFFISESALSAAENYAENSQCKKSFAVLAREMLRSTASLCC